MNLKVQALINFLLESEHEMYLKPDCSFFESKSIYKKVNLKVQALINFLLESEHEMYLKPDCSFL